MALTPRWTGSTTVELPLGPIGSVHIPLDLSTLVWLFSHLLGFVSLWYGAS